MHDFYLEVDALYIEPCDVHINVISGHAFVNGLEVFEVKNPNKTIFLESSGFCHVRVNGDIIDIKQKVIFIDHHRQFKQLGHILEHHVNGRLGIMNDLIALKMKNMCKHRDLFKLDYLSSTFLPKYIIGSVKNVKLRTWCSNNETLKWFIREKLSDLDFPKEMMLYLLPKPNRNDIQSHLKLVHMLHLINVINTCPLLHSYSHVPSFKIDESMEIPKEKETEHNVLLLDTSKIRILDVLDLPETCIPIGKKQISTTFYHNNPVEGQIYGMHMHDDLICVLKCTTYPSLITVAMEVVYGQLPDPMKDINLVSELAMIT